jgi:hypothetical protein
MSELIELPAQNVTVVGAFNPAIFQPGWVRDHVPGLAGPLEFLVSGPAFAAPLLRAGDVYLLITSERLVVYGPPTRAGRIAGALVATLPHTPLRASGVNFSFGGRREPTGCGPWRISVESAGARHILGGDPQAIAFSHTARRDDGVAVTLKLSWPSSEPDLLLELNYHRDALARLTEDRAKELAEHAERAVEFEADAPRIREAIFGG